MVFATTAKLTLQFDPPTLAPGSSVRAFVTVMNVEVSTASALTISLYQSQEKATVKDTPPNPIAASIVEITPSTVTISNSATQPGFTVTPRTGIDEGAIFLTAATPYQDKVLFDTKTLIISHTSAYSPIQIVAGSKALTSVGSGDTGASMLIGARQYHSNTMRSLVMNLSDESAMNATQFGPQLLNPSVDSRGFQFRYSSLCREKAYQLINPFIDGPDGNIDVPYGYYSRLGGSFSRWNGTVNGIDTSVGGQVLCGSMGFQWVSQSRPISLFADGSNYAYGAELGITGRLLTGDVAGNYTFRDQVFGNGRRSFLGIESSLFIKMNDLQPFVRVTYFPRPSNHIPGFTGVQLSMGVDALTILGKVGERSAEPTTSDQGPEPAKSNSRILSVPST